MNGIRVRRLLLFRKWGRCLTGKAIFGTAATLALQPSLHARDRATRIG